MTNDDKLANVRHELSHLRKIAAQHFPTISPELARLSEDLHKVNAELWDIEDGKRKAEAEQCFDSFFIELARSVYKKNDLRARLKREVNDLLGSAIVEEKSHGA